MQEKEQEHQRQIEEQKQSFLQKEREMESQKTSKMKIEQLTREIKPMIDEANEIAKQLGQNVVFSFGLTGNNNTSSGIKLNLSNFDVGEKQYDIEVKVNNLQSEEQYIWDRAKFKDRLMVMRDLLSVYENEGDVDSLAADDNPFADTQEPTIIGEGYFRLEPLAYLIDNPCTIDLIGSNYEPHGQLEVDVIPIDQDGSSEINEDDLPEMPEDLLNRRIDFLISIQKAKSLPGNFCKDVFVEYQLYLEDTKYRTAVVEGKNRNPEFNYQFHHTQELVTESFLSYIKDQVLTFRVLGFPDVQKQDGALKRKKTQRAAQQQA